MEILPDEIVDWFFERSEDVLDAVTDSYTDQEAEQAIAWALEQAYLSGVNYGRKENARLFAENEELRKKYHDAAELAFQGALTSDRMKLDLILSGCLVNPNSTFDKG